MKRFAFTVVMLLVVPALCPVQASSTNADQIYFDDSGPDLMLLGNDTYYEIAFRKSNGSIAYVMDKTTGQQITLGSRYECLWGAVFPDGTPGVDDYVGGCSYRAAWPNRFSYTWSAAAHRLIFDYHPDPAALQQVTAQVIVTASASPWFDMRLQLQNNWGYLLDYVVFPSDLVFVEDDIEEAVLPVLPGIVLERAFFDQNRTYTAKYPGYPGLFADYVSVSSTKGRLAIYSLYGQGPIRPCIMGFTHDDAYLSDSTFYSHAYGARIDEGDTWTTPWVRLRVSQSALETIHAYRVDNRLDQFRTLPEKLGAIYTQTVQSPLYKADAVQLEIPFSHYPDLLAQVPWPGILHPVAYQPRGHDENYPDFLPPDPAWGTIADLAAMFDQAQASGWLVMPYTNPTWWDDESPTLRDLPLPLTITDVAVIDLHGVPVYERYGAHGGYVVSPWVPFVQQRLDQLVAQMTQDVPSDLLFEDQIGARPWLYDHNPPSPYPMAYIDGWLEHTRAYSDTLLMTELGFDRLAETEAGFHGSIRLPERSGYTSGWWGTGTWHPYPLAPLLVRDKVLFYQHDLAPETMTVDKAALTWNLAFGYLLSYDLGYGGGLTHPWLGLVGAFQRYVLARHAGEAMTGFVHLEDKVTRTSFETHTVVANWDEKNAYAAGPHTIPPLGSIVTRADGTMTAGVLTGYNGVSLSAGDHYLIEERGPSDITVRQPLGADTGLTLEMLPAWSLNDPVQVGAYTAAGQWVESVPFSVRARNVTFVYRRRVEGQPIAYYKVAQLHTAFLPLALSRQ